MVFIICLRNYFPSVLIHVGQITFEMTDSLKTATSGIFKGHGVKAEEWGRKRQWAFVLCLHFNYFREPDHTQIRMM